MLRKWIGKYHSVIRDKKPAEFLSSGERKRTFSFLTKWSGKIWAGEGGNYAAEGEGKICGINAGKCG